MKLSQNGTVSFNKRSEWTLAARGTRSHETQLFHEYFGQFYLRHPGQGTAVTRAGIQKNRPAGKDHTKLRI